MATTVSSDDANVTMSVTSTVTSSSRSLLVLPPRVKVALADKSARW